MYMDICTCVSKYRKNAIPKEANNIHKCSGRECCGVGFLCEFLACVKSEMQIAIAQMEYEQPFYHVDVDLT